MGDLFLRQYEPGYFPNQGASLTKCDFENTPLTPKYGSNLLEKQTYKDKSCEFNKEWLSDQGSDYKCITQEDYGYRFGKPCILVKLNRINGFNGTGAAGQWSEPSVYSSLIWFRHGAGGNWGDMKASMDLFLRQYEPGYFPNQGASLTKCDFENTPLTPKYNNGDDLFVKATYKDKSCEFNK